MQWYDLNCHNLSWTKVAGDLRTAWGTGCCVPRFSASARSLSYPLAFCSHRVNTSLASPCLLLLRPAVCSPLTAWKFGNPCALPAATDVSVKVLRTPDEQQLSLASQQEATRTCCTNTGCSSIVGAAGWSKLTRAQQLYVCCCAR